MQIIIIQTEIEQAIRDYVTARLKVADGQRIDIGLSATRGEDGFRATIDIVAETTPAKVVTPEPTPAPAPAAAPKARTLSISKPSAAVAVPKVAAKAEPVEPAAPAAEVVTEAADAGAAQEDTVETDPPFDVTPAAEAEAAPATEAAQQVETAVAAAPATTGRALFAHLKKT